MKYAFVFVSLLLVFSPILSYAQEPDEVKEVNQDDLGNVEDKFQELFFKAIKLRAIENYNQAIETLDKCLKIDKKEAAVYVELGKNYIAIESLDKAEKNFVKAIELLDGEQKIQTQLLLFDVLKNQKKYNEAAQLAQNLIDKGEDKEIELIEIYMLLEDFSKALDEIELLEKEKGYTNLTNNFRDAIFKTNNNYEKAITYYKNRIDQNPLNEDNYFRLINFYKLQDNSEAILKTAKALEQINPLQDELPFILSIVHLQENKPEKAFEYAKKVLKNNALDEQVKTQLIQAFKKFVAANPAYQTQFVALLDLAIEEGESAASNQERAEFYLQRDVQKALEYYQQALVDQPNSFELHQKIIVLQLKEEMYQNALTSAENALEVFPAQVVFYYFKGRALYGLTQYDEAISVLEEGLSYLFETSQLEVDLLELLAETHFQLENNTQAETYQKKALNAKQKLDKME
ncbi:tetratricopeptide repeat protein [Psychroflexus planctonicus]|uniref:Cytochrome c biosynthesis protein n=1 Tax=Psychroflexus planctonicus TaxID=1526575 RepID=A0ABQ1SES4_9FLAO|nr:tetratricopeptide repeat protein [Psychroflexus planctonicus]GGE33962.1 cytochrome c biosynthesis protein [Psychroflexus planctonicus]